MISLNFQMIIKFYNGLEHWTKLFIKLIKGRHFPLIYQKLVTTTN